MSNSTLKPAILVGGGGHSCVLLDAIRSTGGYRVHGFVAPAPGGPLADLGVNWLGKEEGLLENPTAQLRGDSMAVFIGIGDNRVREEVTKAYLRAPFAFFFPSLVHARAHIALGASIGDGVFVAAGAVIGASASLGEGALINVNATVDHHGVVGRFASLAQGAAMGGGAELGERSVLGIGANLRHATTVGADTVIDGGAYVHTDIDHGQIAGGVPATVSGSRKAGDSYLS